MEFLQYSKIPRVILYSVRSLFFFILKLLPIKRCSPENEVLFTVTCYICTFGPTLPTSAGKHCPTHYLFDITNVLQISSDLSMLKIEARTLEVCHIERTALLSTCHRLPATLHLVACKDKLKGAFKYV